PETRVPSASDFCEAGPFVEMVDLGVAAVRLQGLNQILEWDGNKMEFTNIPEAATIKIMEKDGFKITDGHPTFNNTYTDPINARQFAANLIKRQYREGYVLPEMPE
ncbi:MAG: gfo/Idh/MocA family oxidoreductase, partial [Candidatus Cryptobacteroides sp.]|nr:gfo/Idh/MocA family oxidoreductase [Candidatus Cryptobacteroides sp.]